MNRNQVSRQISKIIIITRGERNTDGQLLQVWKGGESARPGAWVEAVLGRGNRVSKFPEGGRSPARSRWEKESRCGLIMAKKEEVSETWLEP